MVWQTRCPLTPEQISPSRLILPEPAREPPHRLGPDRSRPRPWPVLANQKAQGRRAERVSRSAPCRHDLAFSGRLRTQLEAALLQPKCAARWLADAAGCAHRCFRSCFPGRGCIIAGQAVLRWAVMVGLASVRALGLLSWAPRTFFLSVAG